mmetsp:Transcript_45863/g.52889  ORF Transcript_45863/g.52889 Transcript_45863/m.52889 type:complete len:234 (-) Transcript_45863:998-1699(-)
MDNVFSDFGGFGSMEQDVGFRRQQNQRSRNDRDIFALADMMNFGDVDMGQPGQTKFKQYSYVQKQTYDSTGNPHVERYQSQVVGGSDRSGIKMSERQQAYQNSLTGLEKVSHERTLNDKGRKVVKGRMRGSGEQYSHDIFKNMDDRQIENFDRDWEHNRQALGITSNTANRPLPIAGNREYGNFHRSRTDGGMQAASRTRMKNGQLRNRGDDDNAEAFGLPVPSRNKTKYSRR